MLQSKEACLEEMLTALQLEITLNQKRKLLQYTDLVIDGLKRQRLTGEKSAEGIISRQLYDSLYPLTIMSFQEGSKVLDLGSGAGLPGVPIKICLPEVLMSLLDANQRKIKFLIATADLLGLDKIEFIAGRAEELAHNNDLRENYDFVLAKAVANIAVLAELALPMLKIGGQALLYKGPKGSQEAELAGRAIDLCGGSMEKVCHYNLLTGERRSIFLIRKIKNSPPQYPRKAGKPARRPLT